jgi:hypothetical protein
MTKNEITQLKEDIKKELRLEMKAELKKLVKEEIHTILFEERAFETPLTTYIKSLAYKDIHYLIMLNNGLVKHGSNLIEIPETSTGTVFMKLKKNINFKQLYDNCIESGIMEASFDDFKAVLNFEAESGYIFWLQKARKSFTYKGIFELYESVYDEDFFNLNPHLQRLFIAYLSNKFLLEGKPKLYVEFEKSFNKVYKGK